MTDLTPPPDRPLDDAARARLRAQLLESLGERPGTTRRWLAPVAAAAAVVLIAGVIGFLALRTGAPADSGAPGGGFAADPTATPTPASSEPPNPQECADELGAAVAVETLPAGAGWPAGEVVDSEALVCVVPDSEGNAEGCYQMRHVRDQDGTEHLYVRACKGTELPSHGTATPSAPENAGEPVDACEPEVRQQLEDAEEVIDFPSAKGTTTYWVAGDRYVLCDDSGGKATTHRAAPLAPPDEPTAGDLRFSSKVLTMDQDQMVVAFVAGGLLPERVEDITYEWPGGHVETADVETDAEGRRWWRMEYTSYDGPLSDPQQNRLELGPVAVTVVGVGTLGDETVVLEFGRDDCAQVNHGC